MTPLLIRPFWLGKCDEISGEIRNLNADKETFRNQLFRRQLSALELLDLSSLKYIKSAAQFASFKREIFYETFDAIFENYRLFDLSSVWSDVYDTLRKRGYDDNIDKVVASFHNVMCKWMIIHMIDKNRYKQNIPEPPYCVTTRSEKNFFNRTFLIFPGYLVVANNTKSNISKNRKKISRREKLFEDYEVLPDGGEMVDFYITLSNVVRRHYQVPSYVKFVIGSIQFIYASKTFANEKGIDQGVYQVYRVLRGKNNRKADVRIKFVASPFIDKPTSQDVTLNGDTEKIQPSQIGKRLFYGAGYIINHTNNKGKKVTLKKENVDYIMCDFIKIGQQPPATTREKNRTPATTREKNKTPTTREKRRAEGSPSGISNDVGPRLPKTPNKNSSPINTDSPRAKESSVGDRGNDEFEGFEVVLATPQAASSGSPASSRSSGSDVSQEEDGAKAWRTITRNMRGGGESKESSGSEKSFDGKREWEKVLNSMRNGGFAGSPSQQGRQGGESKINGTRLRFGDSPPKAPPKPPKPPKPPEPNGYIKLRF